MSEDYQILRPKPLVAQSSAYPFASNIIINNDSQAYNFTTQGDHLPAGTSENNVMKMGKKKGEEKIRRPRFAFQTRSHADILDDGYRWRKYGQKAVKNNKFPRGYYRCTFQGCNVKKQVQRLTNDEGIVVTTYEGTHTHPIEQRNEDFAHILRQMDIYPSL